jgi:hypothetical protein
MYRTRAGLPGVVGGHRRSRRCWPRQWGMVCSFGSNFPKVKGCFWQMTRMVLVQAEEQWPLRREAMKHGDPGDNQTLWELKMRQPGSREPTTIICLWAKEAFFT